MRILATSWGLWRRRRDVARAIDASAILPPFSPAQIADGFAGWGAKTSGKRARQLADRHRKPLFILEDGFLTGTFPGTVEPAASLTVDTRGPHYDAARLTDLEAAIIADDADRERARAAIDAIVSMHLTKYNNAPLVDLNTLGLAARPFVLLVEQVPGDASLGEAGPETFSDMLREARTRFPDHQLVVRPHPAARGNGQLALAAREATDAVVLQTRCNPWPLLAAAHQVFTHSSHLGFEALMAGTPVTCFGAPFYAGWGLTQDRRTFERRDVRRDLETVFAAAYLQSSCYLDLHTRELTTLEATIEALACIRDQRTRNRPLVVTAGLSPWKRRAVTPFLTSLAGPPRHFTSVAKAVEAAAAEPEVDLAVWGADTEPHITDPNIRLVRLEDGFLRSTGLGAALRLPISLIRASEDALPFDARKPNVIERSLIDNPPDEAKCRRAATLISSIIELGVTKYMAGGSAKPLPESDRLKVLVIGQVEDDASIRHGAPGLNTNTALLAAARKLFPDALIAYRDHPDVAAGLRPGRAARDHADLDVDAYPIATLLGWCDRVETITSGTGFEALLRDKPVGTYGRPFYAGWGLTEDRLGRPARGTASVNALASTALIQAPTYIHPRSRLPCTPERAVEALADPIPASTTERLLLHPTGLLVGRGKHLFKR